MKNNILEFFPRVFKEQEKERENLQSACQHIKDKNGFGEVGERREIPHRSYNFQTRSDIVQRSCNRGKVCNKIKVVQ